MSSGIKFFRILPLPSVKPYSPVQSIPRKNVRAKVSMYIPMGCSNATQISYLSLLIASWKFLMKVHLGFEKYETNSI